MSEARDEFFHFDLFYPLISITKVTLTVSNVKHIENIECLNFNIS